MIRYWLTPPVDAQFDAKVTDICTLYQTAPTRAAQGERIMSTDELTGVQALERKHPGFPLAPGHVARVRELVIDALDDTALCALRDSAERILDRIEDTDA